MATLKCFGGNPNLTFLTETLPKKNNISAPMCAVHPIREILKDSGTRETQTSSGSPISETQVGHPRAYRSLNIVLAAYTTSQANLKLHEDSEALKKQLLYYDTDSVLYVHKEGMHKFPEVDYLSEITHELVEYELALIF
ncbi:hypothetical protein J6590_052793 [Homalodisca vitripennis]|nr:hypothetical protein J6590_052793 [Homalodisca vitripennis]